MLHRHIFERAKGLWSHLSPRLPVLLVLAIALMVGGIAAANKLHPLDNAWANASFALRETPASGDLHIVEMDAASVASINRWPWAREHYARVVDRLDAAGVRSIAFDVDFSTASDARQDRIFASALAKSNAPVLLPTFAQIRSHGSRRSLDSLPIPELRRHASLGSVLVAPGADGTVRRLPLGTITEGVPRPALSAQIAQAGGDIDSSLVIDYAIDPDTIPRHSFVAVENGVFDADSLRGKDVLIGATAIEMGDRYTTPRYGVLPGVVVQALATETLYRGIPIDGGWILPFLLALAMGLMILRAASGAMVILWAGLGAMANAGIAIVCQIAFNLHFSIIAGLLLLAGAAIVRYADIQHTRYLHRLLSDSETDLPNLRALEQSNQLDRPAYSVAARIGGFDALRAVIGDAQLGTAVVRLVERLRIVVGDLQIGRIDDRVIAWTTDLSLQELTEILNGLRAVMRNPVEVAGRRIDIPLTFGVAEGGKIAAASHAAAQAARKGDPWRLHEDTGNALLDQSVSLMGELDEGVDNGQLQVHYQPKLNLRTGQIDSAEALVRWQHPVRGFLRPDIFIPMAEESNRISDLTLFVLKQTIADLRQWNARGHSVHAAVNISARLISNERFVKAVEALISAPGAPRDRLTFEVTESATIENAKSGRAALENFRAMGIAVSMDDYGTGQSSLSYLKNLPLSELKIDRSFVQFAHRDRSDALLVESTVHLAHEFGLKVVAEGVEDQECLEYLKAINCDYAQGYLIGKPMPAAAFEAFLTETWKIAA